MERWQAKLLALIGSFVLPLLATMLPYKVSGYVSKKGKQGKRVLSYLMCFGGGIFFGTFLLHMGPEVHLLLSTSLLGPYGIHYPLTDLFIGIGFFLVLFSEKFVLKWNKRRTRSRSRRRTVKAAAIAAATEEGVAETETEAARVSQAKNGATNNGTHCAECAAGKPCSNPCHGNWDGNGSGMHGNEDGNGSGPHGNWDGSGSGLHGNGDGNGSGLRGDGCHENGVGRHPTKEEEAAGRSGVGLLVISGVPPSNDDDDDDDKQPQQQQQHHHHHHSTRSIILIIALSMHRIFEGMTIGLQSSVHNIWSLFLAVMCHELVIGFSLGLQLVKSRLSLRQMSITSFICSAIMPLGVAVGIALTELGSEGDGKLAMANGILQAMAMGTFIYVTFFEILQEEVNPDDTSLGKIFFIFAGFVMMALLDLIPEDTTIVVAMTTGQGSLLCNASSSAMTTAQPTILTDVSLSL